MDREPQESVRQSDTPTKAWFWRRNPAIGWLVAVGTLAASAWILTKNAAEFAHHEAQIGVDRAAVRELEQRYAEAARNREAAYRIRDTLKPLGVRFFPSSKAEDFHLDLEFWRGAKTDLVRLQEVNDAVGNLTDHGFGISLIGRQFDDESLAVVARCRNVQYLVLSDSNVSNEGLRQLKGISELAVLSIERTNIDDDGLLYLKDLSGLVRLHTYRSKVTAAGIAELKSALPDLDISREPWDWPASHAEP
jgi:hypothetical protein